MENKKLGQEKFVKLIGFPDYLISNFGRIKSCSRILFNGRKNFLSKEKFLKPRIDTSGYVYTSLRLNKKEFKKRLHRLIAENFISNYSNNLTVNHKDGDKLNNSIDNLELLTLSDNIKHAVANKLHAFGEKNFNSKLSENIVKNIRIEYVPRKITMKYLANKYKISEQVIFDIIHRNTWKYVI